MITSTMPAPNAAVMSFLPSPTNMEINMEPLDSFNTFVMDDPSTPLCIPVCSSFDQEFQLQDNYRINMLPQNTRELKTGGAAEESPAINALPQSSEQIDFPLDLFDYLENVPFDIEELVEEDVLYRNVLCDAGSCQTDQTTTRRTTPISNVPSDELETPTVELVQPQQPQIHLVDIQSENQNTINMEEIYSFSPVPTYQAAENVQQLQIRESPPSLYLNLPRPSTSPVEDVSTPVLIKMLLESEEIGDKKPVVVPPSNLPQAVQDISSCDSAAEISLPSTPIPRSRATTNKRATKSNSSDLRRVRNNEASRKSRQNRRKKQQTQAQMVDVLEEESRRLNQKVKELEALKAEIMKYMTGSIKTTSSSTPNETNMITL